MSGLYGVFFLFCPFPQTPSFRITVRYSLNWKIMSSLFLFIFILFKNFFIIHFIDGEIEVGEWFARALRAQQSKVSRWSQPVPPYHECPSRPQESLYFSGVMILPQASHSPSGLLSLLDSRVGLPFFSLGKHLDQPTGNPSRFLTLLLRANKGLEWPSFNAAGVGGGWGGMRLLVRKWTWGSFEGFCLECPLQWGRGVADR